MSELGQSRRFRDGVVAAASPRSTDIAMGVHGTLLVVFIIFLLRGLLGSLLARLMPSPARSG